MKYVTFVIPCYNSADYLANCIDSLLPAKDDIEIIVVNDGSTDDTRKIANKYKKKYPNVVTVINKKNGGHGSAVNAGLAAAKGLYFKVVDSDDHVDDESLRLVIDKLKDLKRSNNLVDLMITNYVYEKDGERPKSVNYKRVLPRNQIFTWNEVGHFKVDQYLLMHSMIYYTKFLRQTGLLLPEHTFYVDNIFAYYPLPRVRKMYYLDVNLYRYFIGREDQSVNEKVMIGRIDQQLFITKQMLSFFDPYDFIKENKGCARYCLHYLDVMMTVSSILLQVEGGEESRRKRQELWQYAKYSRPKIYRYCLRHLAGACNLPRAISVSGYKLARKFYKFN